MIRILLLIKVMLICDHWFPDPSRLLASVVNIHVPSCFHFDPSKLPNLDFNFLVICIRITLNNRKFDCLKDAESMPIFVTRCLDYVSKFQRSVLTAVD
jgi:hypothetical protein